MQPARRENGGALFPSTAASSHYFIELIVKQRITEFEKTQSKSSMKLAWTRGEKVLNAKYLQPFHGGNCSLYYNCLACLSDTDCGWCASSSVCYFRTGKSELIDVCSISTLSEHLIITPEECPSCSDYVDCQNCAMVSSITN